MKTQINSKQRSDKLLLTIEPILGTFSVLLFFIALFAVIFMAMNPVVEVAVIIAGVACLLSGTYFCLKIEQLAGYYECPRCEHRYIPSFRKVCFCFNFGRTRKMTCESCGRKSWHEKVLTQTPDKKDKK